MRCGECIHYRYCFERRGICKEFKTRKEVIADIERINKAYRSRTANTEQRVQEASETSERLREIHQDIAVQL